MQPVSQHNTVRNAMAFAATPRQLDDRHRRRLTAIAAADNDHHRSRPEQTRTTFYRRGRRVTPQVMAPR